jgi:multiple sugar transport system permease protein
MRRRRGGLGAYLLLLPAVLMAAGVLAYPLAWEVWVSLTDLSPHLDRPARFVGLQNYRYFLTDPGARFWPAVAATLAWVLVTSAGKLALGVLIALVLHRPSRVRGLVLLAACLPWVYPASVAVIGWYWTLNPPLVTAYSRALAELKYAVDGVLGSGAYAFVSVGLFNVWRGAAFTGLFLLAGLGAIPAELFEWGRLECGSAWRRFWLVTVPLLQPSLALAVFLSLTTAFADLSNVWMLTGGRIVFPVVGTQAYWLAVKGGQLGPAAALSLTLVPPLLAALWWLFRLFDPPEERAT